MDSFLGRHTDFLRSRPTRRSFLISTAAAAAGIGLADLLAACGQTNTPAAIHPSLDPSKPLDLTFWTFDSLHVQHFQERQKVWNQTAGLPKLTLTPTLVPGDTMFTKVLGALSAGSGAPDLVALEVSTTALFFKPGVADQSFVALNPYISDIRDQFSEARWQLYTSKGSTYGAESTMSPGVFWYRKDIFDQLGLNGDMATINDFQASARKLKANGKYIMELVIGGDTVDWNWVAWFLQFGGNIFDKNGAVIFDQGDAALKATELYLQMLTDKLVMRLDSATVDVARATALKDGTMAGSTGPDWWGTYILEDAVATTQGGKWRVALLPAVGGRNLRSSTRGGSGICITKQAKNPDGAFAFLKFCYLTLDGQITRFKNIGYFPNMIAAWKDPAVTSYTQPFTGDQPVGKVLADSAAQEPTYYASPFKNQAEKIIGSDLVFATVNGKTLNQSLIKEVADKIRATVKAG